MAFRLVLVYFLLVVALFSFMADFHDCKRGYNGLYAEAASGVSPSRKILVNSQEVIKSSNPVAQAGGNEVYGWSLRAVPSGPDPLHHNTRDPKKPDSLTTFFSK